jgi:magnesium-transporting ATPase (P-type)
MGFKPPFLLAMRLDQTNVPMPSFHVILRTFFRDANAGYRDNSVTTSKYTAWNFVPLFLFQQFSRFANAYFLCVCILQCIPQISITSGIPTSIFPLAFVLFFDGLVTAREDYKRHQDDAKANAKTTYTLQQGNGFARTAWRDIRVGDIVKVTGCVCLHATGVFTVAV